MVTIAEHVAAIDAALRGIFAELGPDLPAEHFHPLIPVLKDLERVCHTKGLIDALVAHLAQTTHAGDTIGTAHSSTFLREEFGLSAQEAHRRLRRGAMNYAAVAGAGSHEQAQQRAAVAVELDTGVSAEKAAIIERELRSLRPEAAGLRDELHHQASAHAAERSPEDLRDWVRRAVTRAGGATPDPFAGIRKRYLAVAAPDADGGARISGYLPAHVLAQLEVSLAPARRPGHLLDETRNPEETDARTLGQRRVDALADILTRYNSGALQRRQGIGSVVLSLTPHDLAEPHGQQWWATRHATNTNARLNFAEFLALGAAPQDVAVIHDPDTGQPLHCGRTKRSATLLQRLSLFAAELVCTHPGCTQPAVNCDVHHIESWARGGPTDIENLTLLCRRHHSDNNDARAATAARGWAARDEETGRVGWQPPAAPGQPRPPIKFNETTASQQSGGARIRATEHHRSEGDSHSDPPRHAA